MRFSHAVILVSSECMDLWAPDSLFLSFSQVTWGTKQTLSAHCNPAFPRFLALGNQQTHSEEGEKRRRKASGRQKREEEGRAQKAGGHSNFKSFPTGLWCLTPSSMEVITDNCGKLIDKNVHLLSSFLSDPRMSFTKLQETTRRTY